MRLRLELESCPPEKIKSPYVMIVAYRGLDRVSIKSFPDYKHLLQENYVEYRHIFLPLLKLVSKILCPVFICFYMFIYLYST